MTRRWGAKLAKSMIFIGSEILSSVALLTSSAHATLRVDIQQVSTDVASATGTSDGGGVSFSVATLGGTLLYAGGPTLDTSSSLDLDIALLIITNISAGDQSGLSVFPDGPNNTVTLTSPINYGSGSGALNAPMIGGPIFETWTGLGDDFFTETLSEVLSINRDTPDVITVVLSGTLSDSDGAFVGRPANLVLSANQSGGPGAALVASITNTALNVPEPSTWAMMLIAFAVLGYTSYRQVKRARVQPL